MKEEVGFRQTAKIYDLAFDYAAITDKDEFGGPSSAYQKYWRNKRRCKVCVYQKEGSEECMECLFEPVAAKFTLIKAVDSVRRKALKRLQPVGEVGSSQGKEMIRKLVRKVIRGERAGATESEVVVVLRKLPEKRRYKDIVITTPERGRREMFYGCEAESRTGPVEGEDCKTLWEDWRVVRIEALPAPLNGNAKAGNTSPSAVEDKSLSLQVPVEYPYVFSVNGISDEIHSIMDVISGGKMSTPFLDAYLMLRMDSYNNVINAGVRGNYIVRPSLHTNFRYLSCHFFPVLKRNEFPTSAHANMGRFPDFPLSSSILLAPQFICGHFYLAVFNFLEGKIRLYDSSWHYIPMEMRMKQVKKILTLLLAHGKDVDVNQGWEIETVPCAQQMDESSCGVYTIYFTENELKGKTPLSRRKLRRKEVSQIRTEVVSQLLRTTQTGTRILEALTA